jgi:hypothetical protein
MLRPTGDVPGASGDMPDTDRRLPDVCSALIRTVISADQKGQAHRGSWVQGVGQERSGVAWECPEWSGNIQSGPENHTYPDSSRVWTRFPQGYQDPNGQKFGNPRRTQLSAPPSETENFRNYLATHTLVGIGC